MSKGSRRAESLKVKEFDLDELREMITYETKAELSRVESNTRRKS